MTELVKSTRGGPFAQSLADFVNFFKGYKDITTQYLKDDERYALVPAMETLCDGLIEQSTQLNNRFLSLYDSKEANDLSNGMDDYTVAMALNSYTKQAVQLVAPTKTTRASGLLGGLLPGLGDILEPIKKIIKLILDAFPIGGVFGKIIGLILDIINNLFGNTARMVSEDAGNAASQARNGMYEHLQQIYSTNAAASKLRRAINDEDD